MRETVCEVIVKSVTGKVYIMFFLVGLVVSTCDVIANQTVTKRIHYAVPRDFCVLITSSLFANCSCDYFDNGGAICIAHTLSTFECDGCTFYGCACDFKFGGGIFLDVQNETITRTCGAFCRSKFGQFADLRANEHVIESVTVFGATSEGRFEASAAVNVIDGSQSVKLVNSSRNELSGHIGAGFSVMPGFLTMKMCSFTENVGDSIFCLNFRAEKLIGVRNVELVNFVSNTISSKSPRQAVVMIFIDNVTIDQAIFKDNNAPLVAYQAGNVESLFERCVFDCGSEGLDIEMKDCIFQKVTNTHDFDFVSTGLCEVHFADEEDNKVVIIVATVVSCVAVVLAVLLIVMLYRRKKRSKPEQKERVEQNGNHLTQELLTIPE